MDDDHLESWKVPCPECDAAYGRSPMASHIYCPDCGTTFHQEWEQRQASASEETTLWTRAYERIQQLVSRDDQTNS